MKSTPVKIALILLIVGFIFFDLYFQSITFAFTFLTLTLEKGLFEHYYAYMILHLMMFVVLFWMLAYLVKTLIRIVGKENPPSKANSSFGKKISRAVLLLVAVGAAVMQIIYLVERINHYMSEGILYAISFLICIWCIWYQLSKFLCSGNKTPEQT